MPEVSRQSLLNKARSLADKLGRNFVLRAEFMREFGLNDRHVLRHFDSWTELVQEAGLKSKARQPIPREDLFEEALEVFADCQGVPTFQKYRIKVRHGETTYRRRWGTWTGFLKAFAESKYLPLEQAANFLIPRSMPIAPDAG